MIDSNEPAFDLQKVIESARDGDELSFELIVREYRGYINAILNNLLGIGIRSVGGLFGDVSLEREDFFQECLIALYGAVMTYDSSQDVTFKAYAAVCVRNSVLGSIRTVNRKKNRSMKNNISLDTDPGDEDETSASEYITPRVPGPEEELIRKESYEDLMNTAYGVLTPLETKIFRLYIYGYSYNEISDTLNKPVKSVDNAVYRIRTKLKGLK